MREIVHIQAGQCGNQIGAKVFISSYGFKKQIFQEHSSIILLNRQIEYNKVEIFVKKFLH